MNAFLGRMLVLAAETPAGGGGGGEAEPGPMAGLWGLIPIVAIFALFIWFTHRSQKKRQQERQEMLESLRPKDEVYTIGGIKGRIVQITDDELVLRIDDAKDIKITVSRGGIGRKAGEEEGQ